MMFQGHCQAYEFNNDNCDLTDGKFPHAESGNNDHVSHYSKTASPYSAASGLNSFATLTISTLSLLLFKLF